MIFFFSFSHWQVHIGYNGKKKQHGTFQKMKCPLVQAFRLLKCLVWVLTPNKRSSKYTTNLVGCFYHGAISLNLRGVHPIPRSKNEGRKEGRKKEKKSNMQAHQVCVSYWNFFNKKKSWNTELHQVCL
jgi:hypothetical protein